MLASAAGIAGGFQHVDTLPADGITQLASGAPRINLIMVPGKDRFRIGTVIPGKGVYADAGLPNFRDWIINDLPECVALTDGLSGQNNNPKFSS